ncbi:hypothetical protein B0H11DRAFT_1926077 [Mycena galericulata]|nr:hypothetical protein B0H11DRAFT_1926077 [Mycena galericulata]
MDMNNTPQQVHGSHYYPLLKILLAWLVALGLSAGHHGFNASLDNRIVQSGTLHLHSQAGASAIGTAFAILATAALRMSVGTAYLQCAWKAVRQRAFTVSGLDALWSSPRNALAFFSFDFWSSARGIVLISALPWAFPLIVTFAPGTLTVQSRSDTVSGPCTVPTFDFGSSALLYNTVPDESAITRPSPVALEVVGSTLLAGRPTPPTSPCGSHCSYILSANAPSFSCTPGLHDPSRLTWEPGPFEGPSPPYSAVIIDVTPSGDEIFNGWDFEAQFTDISLWMSDLSSTTNLTCVAYNSTYYVNYTFVDSTASVAIDHIDLQQPASQLISGTGPYNGTANYYAVLRSMYPYLIGNISVYTIKGDISFSYSPNGLAPTETPLFNAPVSSLNDGNLTWSSDLPHALESLVQNITLSMLTGSFDATQTTSVNCIITDTHQHFAYNAHRLWLVYGLGLGTVLLCDLVGIVALFQNSFGATGDFSDFLAATRNTELNDLDLKRPQDIRLKYGPIRSEGGRYTFALYNGNSEKDASFFNHQTTAAGEPFLPEG